MQNLLNDLALLLEQDNRLVAEGKLLKTKLLNWLVEAASTLALPNLDSTCDENHVVNTLPLAASTAADVGFIGLDVLPRLATDPVLIRSNHTRTKLVRYLEGGLVARQSELPLKLNSRHAGCLAATKYPAQNQTGSGVCVRSMTVPAVRLVSQRHFRQRSTPGRVETYRSSPGVPQCWHTNPSLYRARSR